MNSNEEDPMLLTNGMWRHLGHIPAGYFFFFSGNDVRVFAPVEESQEPTVLSYVEEEATTATINWLETVGATGEPKKYVEVRIDGHGYFLLDTERDVLDAFSRPGDYSSYSGTSSLIRITETTPDELLSTKYTVSTIPGT